MLLLLCTFVHHFDLVLPRPGPPALPSMLQLPWLFTVFAFSTLHKFSLKDCRTQIRCPRPPPHGKSGKQTHTHTLTPTQGQTKALVAGAGSGNNKKDNWSSAKG